MVLEQRYNTSPLRVEQINMSTYRNMLTPPSSSEDSPQPMNFVASPNATYYQGSDTYSQGSRIYAPQIGYRILPKDTLTDSNMVIDSPRAYLSFIEQPTDRFRFRYKSEMAGTHGSLTGLNSDKSRKQTYPTVQIHNCSGKVIVRCSIYQVNSKGQPIQKDGIPHAHRLIMKRGKDEVDDPHDMEIGPEDDYKAVFHGMGIIHTAKKNLVTELVRKKSQLKVEQFAREEGKIRELTTKETVEIKGLAEWESKSINLNIVCLRFDAFVVQHGILYPICEPIYSHGINNLKSALTGDLKIVRLDHCVSEAKGNKEIFILVERVTKKNIRIRFYEMDDEGTVLWEDYGKFNDLDVHHQYAIVFKTPKYKDVDIKQPVTVCMELVRPSDNARSEPREFRYIPNKSPRPGSKRPRYEYSSEYESSHMDSNELPATIHNLEPVTANPITSLNGLPLSDELKKIMNDINSDEFKRLLNDVQDNYLTLEIDAPKMGDRKQRSQMKSQLLHNKDNAVMSTTGSAIKLEVTTAEKRMALTAIEELTSFVKSKHTSLEARLFIDHHLGQEQDKTNALHISVCQNDINSTTFLLKVLVCYGRCDLINKKNDNGQTPLHLAVLSHNHTIVNWLLKCRASMAVVDPNLNTCLHLALKENIGLEILDLLTNDWQHENFQNFINAKNADGDTALLIAISKNNMTAVKLLCMKGADVNIMSDKTGFVPLRLAIEKQNPEIVKYLLSLKNIYPDIKDFASYSPLEAGLKNQSEISQIIRQYMQENHLEVEIKEEIEEDSDEEMEEDIDVKPLIISTEELKPLYDKVKYFMPMYLDEVAAILDGTGNWGSLAELLSIDHLINSGIIQSDRSMSKAILTYAIETNGDSLWEIRNFLENLDECLAVETIDRMVYEMSNIAS